MKMKKLIFIVCGVLIAVLLVELGLIVAMQWKAKNVYINSGEKVVTTMQPETQQPETPTQQPQPMISTAMQNPQQPASTQKPQPSSEAGNTPEQRKLIINEGKAIYTYDEMAKDLETLSLAYSNLVKLDVLEKTVDGRNIYDMTIGPKTAKKHVIVHASIHAREYITTQLVMKQLSEYLYSLSSGTGEYKGMTYKQLFEDVCVHVVPMVNPDGVSFAQNGFDGLLQESTKNTVKEILLANGESPQAYDFSQWKSNASGVDLNRNYDAKWKEFQGAGKPAPDRYKGSAPASEPETRALIKITTENPVKRTISYHTYGEVIYWYFGQTGDVLEKTKAFAQSMSKVTGYPMDANYENLDPAGYKDWAIDKLQLPSITIEVGHGKNPVPMSQFESIYAQNKNVWAELLYGLK